MSKFYKTCLKNLKFANFNLSLKIRVKRRQFLQLVNAFPNNCFRTFGMSPFVPCFFRLTFFLSEGAFVPAKGPPSLLLTFPISNTRL